MGRRRGGTSNGENRVRSFKERKGRRTGGEEGRAGDGEEGREELMWKGVRAGWGERKKGGQEM